jgi:predicted transcriptional regulator
MAKSKSFHDFCDLSRELISVTGREGILWTYLLDDLKLPTPQLQALIFRSLHQQYAYQFFNHQKQEIHSFQSLTEAEAKKVNGIRVYAPLSEIYRILGISSQIEIPPDPGMLILENIAKSKEKGLLMNEIGKLTDKKSAIYPIIDKLVTLGLIQKRMVTPIRHVSNSRGKARVVITHLVRYAHLYDPHKDQMEFEIGEAECEQVQQTIIKLLSQRGVISIPVFLIAPHFQLIAKHMTRRISTCITQLKSKCRLTLTTEKFRGKGPFTFVCCPSLGQEVEEDEDGGGNEDEDDGSSLSPSNTIFNMTVYEQVTYRLNMSNGLTSRKIKQLTGLRKKRCYLIVSTLIKTLKYRHETVQSGRQKLYSILGKNPFQSTAPPPLALSGTPVSPTVPSLPNTSASLQITDLTQGTQVREETRREKESVEGPSQQVDLYSVRKNVITSCLEKTGGIIDNYTLTKETERCYKELNLSTQVDRKTVKRLMMKSVEEGGYEYVANVEHPEVRSFWMKPHLIYQNDLPNIQELLMKYVRKLHAWFIAGKNGRFLDYFHTLSGDPVNPSATAVAEAEQVDPQNPKDGDRVNEEEENSRLEMCQELESQIRTELHLENLLSYREENPHELLDESEGNTKTPVTLDRINSMISLCPHFISSSLSNPLDEVTLKEDNDRFFENLRLIHFQFLRMSQDCVTNRQRSFTCRFIDTLLKMKVKPFISIFGLCDEYLLDINQRIHRVNTRKKYSPSSYDQIFLKCIQQSLPMSALVFSQVSPSLLPSFLPSLLILFFQCPMASAFARVMLSRAVELHKLYVLSLLSLGLIQRSPFPNEIMTAKTIEEFEKTLLLSMGLQIATKPPGTTKLMKKITQYNQYWDETVAPVIAEPLRLKQLTCSGLRLGPSVSSIPVMVNNFFNLNMHLGCHSLEEFPSVALLSEQLANLSAAATATPKRRATKRKGTSDAVSSSPGGDFEKGTQHQMTPEELIAEEENVEVVEFEELNRPNKRFRKEEPIEVLADQVSLFSLLPPSFFIYLSLSISIYLRSLSLCPLT